MNLSSFDMAVFTVKSLHSQLVSSYLCGKDIELRVIQRESEIAETNSNVDNTK